jgi:hypothetical protein
MAGGQGFQPLVTLSASYCRAPSPTHEANDCRLSIAGSAQWSPGSGLAKHQSNYSASANGGPLVPPI